ncbi:unnamed protein product [Closterium sp. NIES-54]
MFKAHLGSSLGLPNPPLPLGDSPSARAKPRVQLLFIRRNRTNVGGRRILDDESDGALYDLFYDMGFKIRRADFTRLSFRQQYEAVLNAEVIVGVHGAGLTSAAAFARNRSVVLEIMPHNTFNPRYYFMAVQAGVSYFLHQLRPGAKQPLDEEFETLTVRKCSSVPDCRKYFYEDRLVNVTKEDLEDLKVLLGEARTFVRQARWNLNWAGKRLRTRYETLCSAGKARDIGCRMDLIRSPVADVKTECVMKMDCLTVKPMLADDLDDIMYSGLNSTIATLATIRLADGMTTAEGKRRRSAGGILERMGPAGTEHAEGVVGGKRPWNTICECVSWMSQQHASAAAAASFLCEGCREGRQDVAAATPQPQHRGKKRVRGEGECRSLESWGHHGEEFWKFESTSDTLQRKGECKSLDDDWLAPEAAVWSRDDVQLLQQRYQEQQYQQQQQQQKQQQLNVFGGLALSPHAVTACHALLGETAGAFADHSTQLEHTQVALLALLCAALQELLRRACSEAAAAASASAEACDRSNALEHTVSAVQKVLKQYLTAARASGSSEGPDAEFLQRILRSFMPLAAAATAAATATPAGAAAVAGAGTSQKSLSPGDGSAGPNHEIPHAAHYAPEESASSACIFRHTVSAVQKVLKQYLTAARASGSSEGPDAEFLQRILRSFMPLAAAATAAATATPAGAAAVAGAGTSQKSLSPGDGSAGPNHEIPHAAHYAPEESASSAYIGRSFLHIVYMTRRTSFSNGRGESPILAKNG